MLGKKLTGTVFLRMLFAVPCLIAAGGGGRALLRAAGSIYAPLGKLETAMAEQFPAADRLRKLEVSFSYMGGQKEQNGVFISGDSLTLDVQPKSLSVINGNTLAMIDFADEHQIPSYVMLIPTACAVQQGKVPYDKVAPLYNQRQLIDDVYRRVSGHVTAIDVYPTLFNHQDEYIYYNTDNTITGLGGYYIYTAAAKNLLRLTNTKWSIWITIITAICMRCLLTGRFQPTVCRYTPMCRVISAIISSRITTLPVSAGIIRCIRAFGRSLTIRWGSCLAACRR